MKRFVAFVLLIGIVASLCACKPDTASMTEPETTSPTVAPEVKPTEPEPTETEPDVIRFSEETPLTVENMFSASVVRYYVQKKVVPPRTPTTFTYYEAGNGHLYAVLVADVTNLGTETPNANALWVPKATISGVRYSPFVLVEAQNGAALQKGSMESIAPQQTSRLYFLYTVPETADFEKLTVTFTVDDEDYEGSFSLQAFEDQIPILSAGSTVTDGKTLTATLETAEFTDLVEPSDAQGGYMFFEAQEGELYLAVKLRVTNLTEDAVKFDALAGISCLHPEIGECRFSVIYEIENGHNFCDDLDAHSLQPQEENNVWYLARVPEEMAEDSMEIRLYIAGEYYKINI